MSITCTTLIWNLYMVWWHTTGLHIRTLQVIPYKVHISVALYTMDLDVPFLSFLGDFVTSCDNSSIIFDFVFAGCWREQKYSRESENIGAKFTEIKEMKRPSCCVLLLSFYICPKNITIFHGNINFVYRCYLWIKNEMSLKRVRENFRKGLHFIWEFTSLHFLWEFMST